MKLINREKEKEKLDVSLQNTFNGDLTAGCRTYTKALLRDSCGFINSNGEIKLNTPKNRNDNFREQKDKIYSLMNQNANQLDNIRSGYSYTNAADAITLGSAKAMQNTPIPSMSIDWGIDVAKIPTDVYLENYEDSDLTRMMALELALGKKVVSCGKEEKIAIMGNLATTPISVCVSTIQEKLLYKSCEGEFYVLDEDQYEEYPEIVNNCKLIDEVPGYYVYKK